MSCRAWLLGCIAGVAACSSDDGPTPRGAGGPDAGVEIDAAGRSDAHPGITPPSKGDACNQAELTFASRTTSVFILVDRSSSMFENGLWAPLEAGVLAIVKQLEADVRFGFAAYTGQNGGVCPDLTEVALAQHNYAAIASAYAAVQPPSYKGETPTSLAVAKVAQQLIADAESGPKYILLVTDGEPDMCDDGNVTCALDAVVATAQDAYDQGVGTMIMSIGGQVDRTHLGDVANAGSGLPVEDHNSAVKYQCNGGTGQYGTAAAQAPFFEPDVADRDALIATLSSAIARTRSCVFDLTGRVQVDLSSAAAGDVRLDGESVPFSESDGFRMNTPSQLELRGSWCDKLRAPTQVDVSVAFPCEALIYL